MNFEEKNTLLIHSKSGTNALDGKNKKNLFNFLGEKKIIFVLANIFCNADLFLFSRNQILCLTRWLWENAKVIGSNTLNYNRGCYITGSSCSAFQEAEHANMKHATEILKELSIRSHMIKYEIGSKYLAARAIHCTKYKLDF